MGWRTVPISELYEGLFDGPHATPPPADAGPVFLGIKNVTEDGRLDFSEIRHISESDFAQWTRRVQPRAGDLVFTYEATLNRYALIPRGFRGCLGRRMALIRTNPAKIDNRFLYYYFFTSEWRAVVANNVLSGSTVDRIPLTTFPSFPVSLPSLPEQHRIADILSAYDQLIENNLRRIRILDAMARAVYRELFATQAPGSADQKIEKGQDLPKGWERTTLQRVCVVGNGVQTGPFGSQLHQSDYVDDGVPVVMPKDLLGFRISTDSIAKVTPELADKLCRHRVQPGDIVYGRRGDIGRRAYVTRDEEGWLCGTGCLRIRPDGEQIDGWYLFNYLGQDDIVAFISGRAHGATMPNLNTGLLNDVPVVLPPRELQQLFCEATLPLDNLVGVLRRQVAILRETRDLLLPRLLSGQIDLADVEPAA